MEDLKIRVTTEQESKEAQELFFELGYEWYGAGKSVSYLECIASGEFRYLVAWKPGCFSKHIIQMGCGKEEAREVSLPHLRDMVVLKRNDPKDATHEDCQKNAWLLIGGDFYMMQDAEWELRGDAPKLLKPIKCETLNDKVASAEVARQELKGVDATLAQRQSQYGSFEGVANITGQLMAIILNSPNGQTMTYAHEEALHMICSKIARIMNGDINHLDSWHDIGGYAKLIEDLIKVEAS